MSAPSAAATSARRIPFASWAKLPEPWSFSPTPSRLAAGVAAILGHNFPCWLKFKGGKGIATSGGVVLAWAPLACLTALATWGVVLVLTKFVSLASIAAALVLPVAVWFWSRSLTMTVVMAVLSALAIYKHKGNIQRLLAGTESRAGSKPKGSQ